MKNIFLLLILACYSSFAGYHKNSRGSDVHTPFRWVFADSAELNAESVTAADTDKIAYQISDSSIWVLRDNSPKTWIEIKSNYKVPVFDSIKFTSDDDYYHINDSSFTAILYSGTDSIDEASARFVNNNFTTTLFINNLSGTISLDSSITIAIPPSATSNFPQKFIVNGDTGTGFVPLRCVVSSFGIAITNMDGLLSGMDGNFNLDYFTITYILRNND